MNLVAGSVRKLFFWTQKTQKYAEDAKGIQKILLNFLPDFFCVFCVTFASSASGCPLSRSPA